MCYVRGHGMPEVNTKHQKKAYIGCCRNFKGCAMHAFEIISELEKACIEVVNTQSYMP